MDDHRNDNSKQTGDQRGDYTANKMGDQRVTTQQTKWGDQMGDNSKQTVDQRGDKTETKRVIRGITI